MLLLQLLLKSNKVTFCYIYYIAVGERGQFNLAENDL